MSRGPNKETEYNCSRCEIDFKLKRKLSNNQLILCPKCRYIDARLRIKEKQYHKRPKYQQYKRNRKFMQYGITETDYNTLFDKQGGVCAICKQPETQGTLPIDHNHKTGKIRGLLCHKCNRAIGSLQENYSILRSASAYLMKHESNRTWDSYFIEFARLASTRSKDPSSQVGAIIVKDNLILSTGYNGFPRGVDDNKPERYERPLKYVWMCHAEENAIFNAAYHGISCLDASIYVTPFSPCSKCARGIVQSGIKEVIVDELIENPRFKEEFELANDIFDKANIIVRKVK